MPAAQHHKTAACQQGADLLRVAAVAGHKVREGQVGVGKALPEHPAHGVVLLVGVGVGGKGKTQPGVLPHRPEVCHKVVALVQTGHRRSRFKGAAAGAAGQK